MPGCTPGNAPAVKMPLEPMEREGGAPLRNTQLHFFLAPGQGGDPGTLAPLSLGREEMSCGTHSLSLSVCAHTHIYPHTHNMHTQAHACSHNHTHAHMILTRVLIQPTHMFKHGHTLTNSHTLAHSYMFTRVLLRTFIYAPEYPLHAQICSLTFTLICLHSHNTHMFTHTHTYAHMRSHNMHTHYLIYTHAHMCFIHTPNSHMMFTCLYLNT